MTDAELLAEAEVARGAAYHYFGFGVVAVLSWIVRLQWGQRTTISGGFWSMVISAARMAGRLGDGGGPGRWCRIFPRPRPGMLGEAEVLQEGHGDHHHECVVV